MTSQPDAAGDDQTTTVVAAGYDVVYAAVDKSPTLRRLWHEHAEGLDFPEEFGHISFTTLADLRRTASELRLKRGDTLAGLGCGMAGPVLWLALETGAHLIGVDLSAVAVEKAGARAEALGLGEQAEFHVGSFGATGLGDGSVDGATSEDALQYAPDKGAAMREIARILRPGGRFVFTAFELDAARVAAMPVLSADPVEDYRSCLAEAGFDVETYEEIGGWPEPTTVTYSSVIAARDELVQEMGEVAVTSLLMEMTMTVEGRPYRRHVLAAATRR